MTRATLLSLLALLLSACPDDTAPTEDADVGADITDAADAPDGDDAADSDVSSGPVVREAGPLTLTLRPDDGTFDLAHDGAPVFVRATADVLVDAGAGPRLVSLADDACDRAIDGDGRLVCVAADVTLALELALDGADGHLEAALTVTNTSSATLQVLRLAPLVVEAERGGALWLGQDPARHRVLENGSWIALDHAVQVQWADAPRFLLGDALPIPLRGGSVSNWNHLVADLDDPAAALVAGWLTFERAVPTVGIGYDPTLADPATPGAFTTYAAECPLIFSGKPLDPGAALTSERFWMQPAPPDALGGLEHYADAVADHLGIVPWPQRDGGRPVPNGWNSWTGSGGTGGYGTNIDEQLIFDNLQVWVNQLGSFGGAWFQIDDGWEPFYGDWTWRTDRFPGGGANLAAAMRAEGMRPGLWIAPFSVDPDSTLAAEHPDWLQKKGDFNFSTDGWKTIDSSNPEVLAWLTTLFTGIKDDGWDWVKLDFSYQALIDTPQYDPTLTNIESWRQGWRAVRDALGPDVFLLGIGAMGPNIGVIDAMRTTLDNNPEWDGDAPDDPVSASNSIKSTVRSGSRRWFYQNRIWVNHPDLIFFRSSTQAGVPPLSLEESRTFATWVGLGGGIVKLGDKLLDMAGHPEWIDVVRRLLPAWPDSARPVDVLVRDYPERWVLPVAAPAGEWTVLGLLNWGLNRDTSTRPPTALPDSPRTYPVSCDDCLVWELWTETFLGRHAGDFEVEVPARDARVLALRAPTGAPQLLGTNRHVTMGANDLGPMTWDATTKTLSGTLTGAVGSDVAPWAYHLAFYAPAGYTAVSAAIDLVVAPALSQDGEVVDLRFSLPSDAQDEVVSWQIVFE
ncbi:MAG: alpha-galactosidase [Deltaproteobacteria bacterium]|nr:MAG: alpha-galactosidase [Deltaproteobacteria bacterium]